MDGHVLVTGASSGIGEAIARAFGTGGARLSLVARRADRLAAVASAFPDRARAIPCDLSTTPPDAWLPAAVAALGPVDVLVNAAGCQVIAPFARVTPADAARMLATNYAAAAALVRAVLPSMVERRSGAIVNVSSVGAAAPPPFMADYVATKAALAAMSESLGAELRGTGVRVLTVYPGPIRTPMGLAGLETFGHAPVAARAPWGDPEDLARAVVSAVERGKKRLTFPRGYAFMRWLPGPATYLAGRLGPKPVEAA